MKRVLLIGFWACMVGSVHSEDTNYLETVSRKWLNGQWNEVRDIGYARIAANTNDIAGYIFLLEYDVKESNVSNALDRLTRIQTLGESFTGEYFRDELPGIAFTRDVFKTLAASGPLEFDAADRQKASLTNKSFGSDHMLEALKKDCYFATNAAERQEQHLKNIREMLVPSGNFLTENRRDPLSIIGYAERHNVPTKEVNRIVLEVAKEQKAELESGGEYTRWYSRAMKYMILRPDPIYLPFLEEASRSTNGFVRAQALLWHNAVKEVQTVNGKKLRPRSNEDSTVFSGTATKSESVLDHLLAVRTLTDQALLAKFALEDKDFPVRVSAAEKITDQVVLARLAVEAADPSVRRTVVEKLADQALLAKIAVEDKDAITRAVAVARLDDQALLARIAVDDAHGWIRRCAADKLTDPVILADRGMWIKPELTRQVTNQTLLAKIAVEARDSTVRLAAVETLADQAALAKIAVTVMSREPFLPFAHDVHFNELPRATNEVSKSDIRKAAVARLADQALLFKVAVESEEWLVREVAVARLEDQALLAKLASTESVVYYVRAAAVEKLADPKLLAKFALKDGYTTVRRATIDKLTDRVVLAKIAAEDNDEYNRKAAAKRLAHLD